jgi:hypothetical protein
MDAIETWHRVAETRDTALLHDLLADDAVFESPVVHTPQLGRAITEKYLLGAMHVLGGESFRYTGEWRNQTGAVLEFETVVDGIKINGVDIIRTSTDGEKIEHFKVMIRPLKAFGVIQREMGKLFT